MDLASNASAEVGLELFRSLSAVSSRTENIFISSYGILSALSMLLLGTKGTSEKELLKFLRVKSGSDAYHQRSVRVFSQIIGLTYNLSIVNGMFVGKVL